MHSVGNVRADPGVFTYSALFWSCQNVAFLVRSYWPDNKATIRKTNKVGPYVTSFFPKIFVLKITVGYFQSQI